MDHTKRVSGRAPRHKKRAGPIAPGEAVAAPSRKQRQRPDLDHHSCLLDVERSSADAENTCATQKLKNRKSVNRSTPRVQSVAHIRFTVVDSDFSNVSWRKSSGR